MKNNLIISIIIIGITGILATGCTNKEAKAQALLVEAISYSEGKAPSQSAQDAAMKLAASKGIKASADANGLTDREVVMLAGQLLCDRILAEYPSTQAAIKASELRNQINQRLRIIGNQRIRSMFQDSN